MKTFGVFIWEKFFGGNWVIFLFRGILSLFRFCLFFVVVWDKVPLYSPICPKAQAGNHRSASAGLIIGVGGVGGVRVHNTSTHMPWHMWRSQNNFLVVGSLLPLWCPWTEVRLLGLCYKHWAVSLPSRKSSWIFLHEFIWDSESILAGINIVNHILS